MTELALHLESPGANLAQYKATIQKIDILTPAQEQTLAQACYKDNDVEAARALVLSHLRFVVHISNNYRNYGLSQADLIQEGNIGLMKAVKRFDPNRGVRLMSFAVHWIKAEMHEYILRNWRIVKIASTKAQRKLFFNLRGMKKHLRQLTRAEATEVAEKLNVTEKDVLHMDARLSSGDVSLDLPNDDEDGVAPAYYLASDLPSPEQSLIEDEEKHNRQQLLKQALKCLDERSRDIISHRWLVEKKQSLQSLADKYNISAERVRQLEAAALKTMRQQIA